MEEPEDLGKESAGKEEELAWQLSVPVEEIPAMLEDDYAESDIDDEIEGMEGMGAAFYPIYPVYPL